MLHTTSVIRTVAKETDMDPNIALGVFKDINDYDWAVFCSQMGDYDHPGERKVAEEGLAKTLCGITTKYNLKEEQFKKLVEAVNSNKEYKEFFHKCTMNLCGLRRLGWET